MYYIRKTMYYFSLLGAIIVFTFVLFHVVPSDPARVILGPNASQDQVKVLQRELGLDKPLYQQFSVYLKRISILDFGTSYVDNRPVLREVGSKFRVSMVLIGLCVLITLLYSLGVSRWIGLKRISDITNFIFISTPTFFSGLITALLALKFLPFFRFGGSYNTIIDYCFLILPALVLAFYPMGILSRIIKEEVSKEFTSQHILLARAYAVPEHTLFYRYALRNAMVPYLAALSNQLPMLFTGAFIVEIIFSVPGIGSLLVKSILERDLPMLEMIVIFNGVIFILTNFLFEASYPLIDPRVNKR